MIDCQHFLSGKFSNVNSLANHSIISPIDGALLGTMPVGKEPEVARAVEGAAATFSLWRNTPIKERVQYLHRFRELLIKNQDALARTISAESGKTEAEAHAGLTKGLEVLEFALALPNVATGTTLEVSRGVWCESRREPIGVVLGIAPFNFPAMVPLWMYPIALALGNCFVLKPSEKVPLTSFRIAQLVAEAEFPPGVFSVLFGDKTTSELLIDHPGIAAVAFVGSTPAARSVYQRATDLGKRALCLGGAKNAMIIAPDADATLTSSAVVASFTGCAGQRCMAGSLLLAVGPVEHIIEKIVSEASGLEFGSCVGAIIDQESLRRIQAEIATAVSEGARIRLDGRKKDPPAGCEGGSWLGPTILDNVTVSMRCASTEIFGPVLSIIRVPTVSAALEIEAKLPFGNATSVFTSSGAVAREVATHATSGMIGVNVGVPVPREPFSFGGTKASRWGACDITGFGAVEFWTNLKKITSRWEPPSCQSTDRAFEWMS